MVNAPGEESAGANPKSYLNYSRYYATKVLKSKSHVGSQPTPPARQASITTDKTHRFVTYSIVRYDTLAENATL